MVRVLRAAPVPLVLCGMLALSGIALGRIFHGPLLALLVAGAAAGSVGTSVGARRLPAWLVSPLSLLALAGYGAWTLDLTAGRAKVPGGLVEVTSDAVRNGIPRLLTAMIPVEPQPDTVVVPVVATWLAGLAAAELAVRGRRALLGYAPPTLLYAAALYVVGPNASPTLWPTLAFAALAAAGLAATARPTASNLAGGPAGAPAGAPAGGPGSPSASSATRLRMAVSSAVALAVVVALAAGFGPAVAARVGTTPVDPRQYIPPPRVDTLDENPLSRISGWALDPDQHLLDVSVSADTAQGARLRLAVLTDYDGVTWHVGATYRNAGRVLPAPAGQTGQNAPVATQRITVAGLSGQLLPAIAVPRQVDGIRVAYDQDSGTLIRPEGLAPGLRYTVTSTMDKLDIEAVPFADVPAGPSVVRQLALGEGIPPEMERLAEQLGKVGGSAYERALAIEEFISTHYTLVADAPSGHAYPNLNFFLFGPRNGGGQRGTSEQFAASFAVLGRIMGLPTRVVVGFQLPTGTPDEAGDGGDGVDVVDGGDGGDGGDGDRAAPDETAPTRAVRGGHAFAWPEVLFTGVGWVPFDPLPRPKTRPRPVEEDFRPKPEQSEPPPSDMPTPSLSPTSSASATNAAAVPSSSDGSPPLLAAGAATVVVLLLGGYATAVPLLRRSQRRRRLAGGDPGRQVAGAWLEVADALRLAGRPAPPHLAATEVVTHAGSAAQPGRTRRPAQAHSAQAHSAQADSERVQVRPAVPPPIDQLAAAVNRTAFAPAFTDEAQARRAVAEALAYVCDLRARRPWWRRLLWSLHPGPLRWHRRG